MTLSNPAASLSLKDINADKHEKKFQPNLGKIRPGIYGRFPPRFNVHCVGASKDQKSRYFCLGEAPSSFFQTFTSHERDRYYRMTLHSTLDVNSPPLALGGQKNRFKSVSILVLPAPAGQGKNFVMQRVNIASGGMGKSMTCTFDTLIADGNQTPFNKPKTFSWCCKDIHEAGYVWELMEATPETAKGLVSGSESSNQEVFAKWVSERNPRPDGKMGEFQFCGRGATGELGDIWTLSAVMTLLRACQMIWALNEAAQKIVVAGGALLNVAVGIGAGAAGA